MSSHLTLPHLHNQWVRAGGDDVPTTLLRIALPHGVSLSPWGWIFHKIFWVTFSISCNLLHHYLICRDFYAENLAPWIEVLWSTKSHNSTLASSWAYIRIMLATTSYALLLFKSMQDECLSRQEVWNGAMGRLAQWELSEILLITWVHLINGSWVWS